MLKVAIIGCGKIADGHAEVIQTLSDAQLVAVCDTEPLMAEQIAVRYSIPRFYSDVDRMFSEQRPDVVHITTPPQSHLSLASKAIDAGCHLYIEKPLAMDSGEAQRLIERVARSGRKMTINYWPNFDPPGRLLDELIGEGVVGEPVHIESYLGYDLTGVYGNALLSDTSHWVHRLPGKLFQNTLDHVVNKIVKFLPDEPTEVKTMAYLRRPTSGQSGVDSMLDELRFMIRAADVTASGVFTAHVKPVGHFMRVYGTKNTIHVDYNSRIVTTEPDVRYPSALGRLEPAFSQARKHWRAGLRNVRQFRRHEFGYFAGMRNLVSLFYACIRDGGEPPVPHRDILRVAIIMDEIFAQCPQGAAPK